MGFPADMDFGTATVASSTRRPLTAARAFPSRLAALLPHPLTVVCWGLETKSEANQRCHWSVRHKRFKKQATQVVSAFIPYRGLLGYIGNEVTSGGRVRVSLTRVGARKLDPDNLAGSTKAVIDSLCNLMGVDDRCERLAFVWDQKRGEPAVVITVECA